MNFIERFLAWWGVEDKRPSAVELRLMRDFAEDVSVFFELLGISEQVGIQKLPSASRQQNLAVDLFGLRWHFQQEFPSQWLTWSSPEHPGAEVGVDYIPHYFTPPSDREIERMANVPVEIESQPKKLSQVAPYVRDHLQSITEALVGDGIEKVARQQRAFNIRIYEARGRHYRSRRTSP